MDTCRRVLVLLALALCMTSKASSDKILLLMPIATKSETHLLNSIANGLLDRGHQVTFVTPASSSILHQNLTEIIPFKPLDFGDFYEGNGNILELRAGKEDLLGMLYLDLTYSHDLCHKTYQHPDFMPVRQAESYDLVVTSAFFSECFLGLIYKLKASSILIASMPLPKQVLDITGMRTPLSFVPHPLIELTETMSLSERLLNTLSSWSFSLLNHHHYAIIGENIYQQYLGNDLPDVETLRKNISLIFSNTHFSINFPRPLMPDVIEIGGVHCRPAKPLPKDLEEFVSGDENGFILFSLGTVFKEDFVPDNLKQLFINVFSRLKIRVLWKWKFDMQNLPKNVKIAKWLPQQDVLGHRNIKLFVSHGGLLSTQESTYHGVAVLGLPLGADQDVNMRQAEARGYGMKLEIRDLTEEIFENAIHKMLNDSSFSVNAKVASALFKDQPQTPLERAVYWMEYIVKHKGAPQLRSHARNLSYIEYHLYDVQLILLSIVGTIVFVAWKITSKCLTCVWAKDAAHLKRAKLLKNE